MIQQPSVSELEPTKTSELELVISDNFDATNEPCALCGCQFRLTVGPEVFVKETWNLVCRECASIHAPELLPMLETVREDRPANPQPVNLVQQE